MDFALHITNGGAVTAAVVALDEAIEAENDIVAVLVTLMEPCQGPSKGCRPKDSQPGSKPAISSGLTHMCIKRGCVCKRGVGRSSRMSNEPIYPSATTLSHYATNVQLPPGKCYRLAEWLSSLVAWLLSCAFPRKDFNWLVSNRHMINRNTYAHFHQQKQQQTPVDSRAHIYLRTSMSVVQYSRNFVCGLQVLNFDFELDF
ncbi:unnamed protein product [Ceratitis capitata]|uniref:(Mediterranean fruit fly) hypothetical protein n=1 Tax=Ceratitis capitata TaxID=7213 RepID=A0A811UBJ1_CERCA|nr:unnamed protein product [Ceratitis capitata]